MQAVVEIFDCRSGKKIKTQTLPQGVNIDILLTFDEHQLVSLEERDEIHFLQIISDNEGYRRILLKETISEPHQRQWPKPGDGIWQTQPILKEKIQTEDGKLVYCWEFQLHPKTGGIGRNLPSLPGTYYAVRDLKTGELLHTDRLPLRPRKNPTGTRKAGN